MVAADDGGPLAASSAVSSGASYENAAMYVPGCDARVEPAATDMCLDMYVDMCLDVCSDMCLDMHLEMCRGCEPGATTSATRRPVPLPTTHVTAVSVTHAVVPHAVPPTLARTWFCYWLAFCLPSIA